MKWTLSSITVLFNFHILGCAVCDASPPLLRPQPFILSKRAWSSIARFFDNCKKKIKGKKGFPKFKKHSRSVEYKQSGWKLDEQTKKHITFTNKNNIGRVKLVGSRDIYFYQPEQIKRVRLVPRADGYYCQFCISIEVKEDMQPTGRAIGLDMGLKYFYADSFGHTEENPRFYLLSKQRLNRLSRRLSRKYRNPNKGVKGKQMVKSSLTKQSNNYHKARIAKAKQHLRVSRQRKDHAVKLSHCVGRVPRLEASGVARCVRCS